MADADDNDAPGSHADPPEAATAGAESALVDGLAHMQAAAREMLEALKLFGEAAERAVADPDGAGAALNRLAEMGRSFVDDVTARASSPSEDSDPDDGVETIEVES